MMTNEISNTDTDVFCAKVLALLNITEYHSFDMANLVAQFAMDCEHEGQLWERQRQEVKTLEFQTGFIPDRRAAAPEITEAMEERVARVNPDVNGLVGPCKSCGNIPVEWDYLVSDEYWRSHVPVDVRFGVVCLPCLEKMTEGVPLNEFEVFYYTNAKGTLPLVPCPMKPTGAAVEREVNDV